MMNQEVSESTGAMLTLETMNQQVSENTGVMPTLETMNQEVSENTEVMPTLEKQLLEADLLGYFALGKLNESTRAKDAKSSFKNALGCFHHAGTLLCYMYVLFHLTI